jgi:integrase/recombinase XerD
MILLAAYEGLRVHEMAKIRGEDVDLAAGTLRVVGKGGVDAVLPLHPLVAAEADWHPNRGYWFPSKTPGPHIQRSSVSGIIGDVMTRAGVPGSPHALRHYFGTEVLKASGGQLLVAQQLLRHASVATTQIYAEVDDTDRRAAVLAMHAVDRGGEHTCRSRRRPTAVGWRRPGRPPSAS